MKIKDSGTLTVKLVDNNNSPLPDIKIKLYNQQSPIYDVKSNLINLYGSILDDGKTDNNGVVNFGELNAGTYYIEADTPKVNGVKYHPQKAFQVIANHSKKITINVEEYTGTLQMLFLNLTNLTPFQDLTVLLVPSENYISNSTIDNYTTLAEYNTTTDASGYVTFKLPSDRFFYVIVYPADKSFQQYYLIVVSKDETYKNTFIVSPNNIQPMYSK